MKLKIFMILSTILTILLPVLPAGANEPQSVTYRGLSLTPAIQNVDLFPNATATSFQIRIDNNNDSPATVKVTTLDFKSLNETGGVAFIGSSAAELEHKYGLAKWLVVPAEPLVLPPHGGQFISVTVDNRADLGPGGHYAAVLFQNTAAGANGGNKVGVNSAVSTLVFVKKSGGEIYSLNLAKPNLGSSWLHLPSNLNLRIKNTGNTQTVPRGTVSITNPSGRQVKRGIINPDSGLVLPDSTRLYKTSLFKTGGYWWPGTYKATVSYRPEDTDQATTVEYNFFYLAPLTLIFSAILIAAAVILTRRYKNSKKATKKDIHKPKK